MLKMTVAEMLEFMKLQQKRRESATNKSVIQGIDNLIEIVSMALTAAVFNTVQENLQDIQRVLPANLIDREALALVIGSERVKAIPRVGEIPFEIEDTEAIVIVDEGNNKLREEIGSLIRKSAIQRLPLTIARYKEFFPDRKIPNGIAYIEIREMFPDSEIFRLWDLYLMTTIKNSGPVAAFLNVKKHLKDFSDIDISIIINESVKRSSESLSEQKNIGSAEEILAILREAPGKVGDYIPFEGAPNYLAMSKCMIVENLDSLPTKQLANRFSQILNITNPDSLKSTLSRKKYVELGYK